MLKTRGRKRHGRSTHKKCINCTNWKERRPCKRSTKRSKRSTRRSTRRNKSHKKRMYGGRTDEPTDETIEGIPVTKDADVSIPGVGTLDLDAFKKHEEYMDFQGLGQTEP